MIYNKSIHPVEVKKISIRLWSLRDEIEAALERRIKECEAAGVPLYIEDIKKFYNLKKPHLPKNVVPIKSEAEGMADLMAEVSEDVKKEEEKTEARPEETPPVDPAPAGAAEAQASGENKTLAEAEGIIAEQTLQGLENKRPNPILERPYQRQAPNLDKISYGFILLSDITMDHMLTFIKDKYLQGQCITIEFLIPQAFMMTADVSYCHHYAMRSKIISSTKPDYRLQLKFSFAIPGERDTLRKFLKSIEPISQGTTEKKQIKKEAEKEKDKEKESDVST
jgi:hypothetical protein